ncbi:MAG: ABC transporter permease subunit [Clostridia bacterium]|nr:ABC transporter permease subunit [Clostridia bacterium]
MIAVFKREFRSFFNTPIGYVVMAILFAFSGYFFYMYNLRSGSTNLTSVYTNLFSIVVLVVLPILTMRSFSEEKRQKTDQALLTSPVSLTGIVVGKFLAAVALFALSLGITLVYAVVIATKAVPDWPVVFGNYVGMMLLAGLIIAAGLFFSSLTESQFIAAILTFTFSFVLMLIDTAATYVAETPWLAEAISFLSVYTRYTGFTQGIVYYDNVFFFLSMQVLFLFLTVRVLDTKRWS